MSNILYKYIDIEGAFSMLHNCNLMYANVSTFNDPLDCHPSLIDYSNVPDNDNYRCPPSDFIKSMHFNSHYNFRNNLWICCLSKIYDSILMWSYYNKHKGICIGLDMDKVASCLHPLLGLQVGINAQDVVYTDIISKPDFYRDEQDFYKYQLLTKAKEWSHEQESRLYINKPSTEYMRLLPFQMNKKELKHEELRVFVPLTFECYSTIYLGVKIEPEHRYKIIKLAKSLNPNIKIYNMYIDSNSFVLNSKLLNL